jgi:hypothetical protein
MAFESLPFHIQYQTILADHRRIAGVQGAEWAEDQLDADLRGQDNVRILGISLDARWG